MCMEVMPETIYTTAPVHQHVEISSELRLAIDIPIRQKSFSYTKEYFCMCFNKYMLNETNITPRCSANNKATIIALEPRLCCDVNLLAVYAQRSKFHLPFDSH